MKWAFLVLLAMSTANALADKAIQPVRTAKLYYEISKSTQQFLVGEPLPPSPEQPTASVCRGEIDVGVFDVRTIPVNETWLTYPSLALCKVETQRGVMTVAIHATVMIQNGVSMINGAVFPLKKLIVELSTYKGERGDPNQSWTFLEDKTFLDSSTKDLNAEEMFLSSVSVAKIVTGAAENLRTIENLSLGAELRDKAND